MKTAFSDIADEDMQIIMAVARNIAMRTPRFHLNLHDGVVLTNSLDSQFVFPGVDLIYKTFGKIGEIDATTAHILVLPSKDFNSRVKIGNLFGMDVFADPTCPSDKFLIEQAKEKEKSS